MKSVHLIKELNEDQKCGNNYCPICGLKINVWINIQSNLYKIPYTPLWNTHNIDDLYLIDVFLKYEWPQGGRASRRYPLFKIHYIIECLLYKTPPILGTPLFKKRFLKVGWVEELPKQYPLFNIRLLIRDFNSEV